MGVSRWLLVALAATHAWGQPAVGTVERSFWVHASLASLPQRGYWGADFPVCQPPTTEQIRAAATLLTTTYGANRLYLVCHAELPPDEDRRVLRAWRDAAPAGVTLVPTLVLRMYDPASTPVYSDDQVRRLVGFCRAELGLKLFGVYDVLPGRDQGSGLAALADAAGGQVVRLGLQPGEKLGPPYIGAVQDTWSGFCHGRRNEEDWQQPGFGAETLRAWVAARNADPLPVAWDLITVAWDYKATERGAYPGYDDAERNDPLPAGRNRLGLRLIQESAAQARLAGFSSDLLILQANSRAQAHDGPAGAIYEALKAGRRYVGTYAAPLDEIAEVYRDLAR